MLTMKSLSLVFFFFFKRKPSVMVAVVERFHSLHTMQYLKFSYSTHTKLLGDKKLFTGKLVKWKIIAKTT